MLQAMAHATAKAAMFMAAGSIYAARGHDRIAGLAGIGRQVPIALGAFAVGGVALVGLPPGGAYLAKELLLRAAAESGQWWWAAVIQVGGAFTCSYVLLVLLHALGPAASSAKGDAAPEKRYVAWSPQAAALSLAICSLALGLIDWGGWLPVAAGTRLTSSLLDIFLAGLWPVLSGGLLAVLLGRWAYQPPGGRLSLAVAALRPLRRGAVALGTAVCRIDAVLRAWPVAGLSLLTLVVVFGTALLTAH
jgi:NADH:ubiquinone oxidoreductase subunit 5 (subunit L)/multisubunit Na+/H+ antiporter MnhA subunit